MLVVRVVGSSMVPTYRPSDLVLAAPVGRARPRRERARTWGRGPDLGSESAPRPGGNRLPRRGDIVVVDRGGVLLVKRLVGVPGDVVELEAGRLSVNGSPLDGRPRVRGAWTRVWHVPPGHGFVAGDAPEASDDSRVWADPFVPASAVRAVAVLRLPRPPWRRGVPGRRGAPWRREAPSRRQRLSGRATDPGPRAG